MPLPTRRSGESKASWRNRIIRQQIEEGKAREQAFAIGYSATKTGRRGKSKK